MLRATGVSLRVSPFLLYQKDVRKQLLKRGVPHGQMRKVTLRQYRQLSKSELAALQKRAAAVANPALDAYNRFQKEYAHRFTHLSNKARNRKVAALWRELKTTGRVTIPAAGAEKKKVLHSVVKAPKKSAKKHVKTAAAKKKTYKKKSTSAKRNKVKTTKPKKSKKSKKSAKTTKSRRGKRSHKTTNIRRARRLVDRRLNFLSAKDRKRVAVVLAKTM